MKPTVFLLCGLPGSGKSTYAKELEKSGVVRYTLDEELFKRFGRHFEYGYDDKEAETKAQLRELCAEQVRAGRSVMLDFGFWKRAARDEYKHFVEQLGANCRLLYFAVPEQELKNRLHIRNETDLDRNHHIDEELMDKFITMFEAPQDEGEEIVEQEQLREGERFEGWTRGPHRG